MDWINYKAIWSFLFYTQEDNEMNEWLNIWQGISI